MKRIIVLIVALAISSQAISQCDKVKITKDKYNPSKSYWSTPSKESLVFSKHMAVVGDSIVYFTLMVMSCNAYSPLYSGDVSVKLADGTVMEFGRTRVSPSAIRGGWRLLSSVTLSDLNIEALKRSPITDFRIGINDNRVPGGKGARAMEYIRCLSDKRL